MAITVSSIEVQEDSTTGTSLQSGTITANVAVGDQVWVLISADNGGTAGVSSITTPTDSGGNTYSLVKEQNKTAGVTNDANTAAIYRALITTALTSGVSTITANFSPSTIVKGFTVFKVTGAADTASSTVGATGAASTYTVTTASVGTDSLVMMIVVAEASTAPGADSDTTNGSWVQATFGTSALGANNNQRTRTGYKIVTGSGTQTYNGSIVSVDWSLAGAVVGFKTSSSFSADAVIVQPGGTFPADAVLLRTQTGSATGNAVLKRTISGSATADAVVNASTTTTGSFTADGIKLKTSALALAADAIGRASASASATADAVLVFRVSGSATANAVLKRTISGSITANAVLHATAGSFTADARIGDPTDTTTERWQHHRLRDHFGYESDLYVTLSESIGPWEEGTPLHFVIDDLLTRMNALEGSTHKVFSFTAGATLLAPGGVVEVTPGTSVGVFAANAVKRRAAAGSFSAAAFFDHKGSFTASAWIRFQGSLTASAILV